MPRVQENAFGIRPSRSISRGSRISTITTSSPCAALMASAALNVSICALASSTRDLIPRWMVWGILLFLPPCVIPGQCEALNPESQASFHYIEIPGSRRARPGMTTSNLPHQFLHRAFEALDRDREHALRKQPANDGGRFRIIPVPLRHRIEPYGVRIGARDAIEPHRARLFIDMLDRSAGHHDLVR